MKHKLEIASVRANEHALLLIILYIVFAQINSMKPSKSMELCLYRCPADHHPAERLDHFPVRSRQALLIFLNRFKVL